MAISSPSALPEAWPVLERLKTIERAAWWRGWVRRSDLTAVFGVSLAQASTDFQRYLELNPGSLAYNLNLKRYESSPKMVCRLHEPMLEEAVSLFGSGGAAEDGAGDLDRIERIVLPMRRPPSAVLRCVFIAVRERLRLRVKYWSVNSDTVKWRWIVPHALAHDGLRWHVRAWCEEARSYRDFVLSRVEAAEWPGFTDAPSLPPDEDWEAYETLILEVNPKLGDVGRRALIRDYGLPPSGRWEIRVRRAMRQYVLAALRVTDTKVAKAPEHFLLGKSPAAAKRNPGGP